MLKLNNINNLKFKNLNSYLTSIYGIGLYRSKYICNNCNLYNYTSLNSLNYFNINCLNKQINQFIVGDDLKKKIKSNIKNYININCYKGKRHLNNLPVRGQRTRNNAKTRKNFLKSLDNKNKFNFNKNVKKKTIKK